MYQHQGLKGSAKSCAPPEELAEQGGGPGVLVLAPPMRLLHMNQRAWDLTSLLGRGENGNGHPKGAKGLLPAPLLDRKSTRLNSSHLVISYAVFCLTKKSI